jgi:hypothetical protein
MLKSKNGGFGWACIAKFKKIYIRFWHTQAGFNSQKKDD